MIKKYKGKLQSILRMGIKRDLGEYEAFLVYSLNFIAVFGISAALISIAVDGLYKSVDVGFPVISSILIFSSILFFNSQNKYGLAKFSLFILFPLVQFISMLYIEPDNSGIVLTILPFLLAAPLGIQNKGLRFVTIIYLIFLCFFPMMDRLYPLGVPFFFNLTIFLTATIIGVHIILNHFLKYAKSLKEQNDTLKFQNEKLQTLIDQNDHKTEMMGILSHDLKAPAASFNELSKKVAYLIKNERYDELQKFGEYFEAAGHKIFNNMDRLLSWTISQKKQIITTEDDFSPFELIDEISQKLEVLNPDRTIHFSNNIPEHIKLKTDARILEIILQNLLSNAVNNSPDEESIVIKSETSTTDFVTSITNQGPALDMNIVRLAESGKFQKSRKGHGLGIGICFSLIKFIEGQIKYESSISRGTTVRVRIPFEKTIEN